MSRKINETIQFLPDDVRCPIRFEQSLLEIALKNGVALTHSCGGMGSCTTCRVYIEGDAKILPPRNELELEIADSRGFANNERLACQLPPIPGLIVRIPKT